MYNVFVNFKPANCVQKHPTCKSCLETFKLYIVFIKIQLEHPVLTTPDMT